MVHLPIRLFNDTFLPESEGRSKVGAGGPTGGRAIKGVSAAAREDRREGWEREDG